jgi:hypothetical protein
VIWIHKNSVLGFKRDALNSDENLLTGCLHRTKRDKNFKRQYEEESVRQLETAQIMRKQKPQGI